MEIKFEKLNGLYVAEFEATSDFNLHIERNQRGAFTIAQRGTKQGKYAYITDENYDDRVTIDVDMLGEIYPKYIKVTSVTEPTYAEVNMKSEGGGESGSKEVIYFTVDDFTSVNFVDLGRLASTIKIKLSDSSSASAFGNPGDIVIIRPIDLGMSGTEIGDKKVAVAFIPELKLFSINYTGTFKDIANEVLGGDFFNFTTEITEDEYYDLTKL